MICQVGDPLKDSERLKRERKEGERVGEREEGDQRREGGGEGEREGRKDGDRDEREEGQK